jgi:TPR repeat protein
MLYESDGNDVVIPDIGYARELFVGAAELGYAASQFRMGCAYEYGTLGCPVDPRKSIAWYSKAAMKGLCP